jgi:hypothetical protein
VRRRQRKERLTSSMPENLGARQIPLPYHFWHKHLSETSWKMEERLFSDQDHGQKGTLNTDK